MRFSLALALAASPVAAQTLPPLPAATVLADAGGAPAFAVPFASKGNRIELAVAGADADALTATVEDAPAWLRLGTPTTSDGAVTLAFDVDRSAPTGQPATLTLRLSAADGRSVVRAVRLVVEPPSDLVLDAPRPNPSAGRVRLGYGLPRASSVEVVVVDVLGREVYRTQAGEQAAGGHEVVLDPVWGAGVYVVRLRAGAEARTTTLVRR